MGWDKVVDRVLGWLENHLPGLLAAFGLGYKVGSSESNELKKKLSNTELKKEYLENEIAVKDRNRNIPDRIRDFIERTRSGKPKP
jgi:hypothetical protein